jgi:hypothetical protein
VHALAHAGLAQSLVDHLPEQQRQANKPPGRQEQEKHH